MCTSMKRYLFENKLLIVQEESFTVEEEYFSEEEENFEDEDFVDDFKEEDNEDFEDEDFVDDDLSYVEDEDSGACVDLFEIDLFENKFEEDFSGAFSGAVPPPKCTVSLTWAFK